jgi:hypothetical protein
MTYLATGGPSFGGWGICTYTCGPSMGILTGPPAAMRQDVLNCVNWQNWALSQYMTNVHVIGATNDPNVTDDFPRPLVVISMTEESMETRIDTGPFTRGTLVMWFEDKIHPCCADPTSAYNQFCGRVESVVTELNGQGIGGMLLRRSIRPFQRPWQSQVNDPTRFYNLSFLVSFGPA